MAIELSIGLLTQEGPHLPRFGVGEEGTAALGLGGEEEGGREGGG